MTLLALSTMFSAGVAVRYVQQHADPVPQDAYEESDRTFFERAEALQMGDPPDSAATSPPDDASPRFRVDVNHAPASELVRLPRVGPKTAQRIIEFRETYGEFRHVEDLTQIRGIGPKTLEQLRPFVVVTPDTSAAGTSPSEPTTAGTSAADSSAADTQAEGTSVAETADAADADTMKAE